MEALKQNGRVQMRGRGVHAEARAGVSACWL